jgi:hypothetical protein
MKNVEDYICEFELCQGTNDLIKKFLQEKSDKFEQDSEIGRICYNFKKKNELLARLCIIQRVELEVKSTLRIYELGLLCDLCKFFDLFINIK